MDSVEEAYALIDMIYFPPIGHRKYGVSQAATMYANDDPKDPEKGPRFVIQSRMFANASNPNINNPAQCGCGCSCGCA